LVNNIVPKGTGVSAALRRSAAALNNYATTSNRNLFYAGTPSAFNLIYFNGAVGDSLLADFKLRLGTFEQASVTQSPSFLSSTGSSADFLHLDPMVSTVCDIQELDQLQILVQTRASLPEL
jgi:trimeric autotransporter adhesin